MLKELPVIDIERANRTSDHQQKQFRVLQAVILGAFPKLSQIDLTLTGFKFIQEICLRLLKHNQFSGLMFDQILNI